MAVIKGMLPDAQAMLNNETWKQRPQVHIRDVPLHMEETSVGATAARVPMDLPEDSPVAKALDARTEPLRQRLGCYVKERVGLKSLKPASGTVRRRQATHYDYSQREVKRWIRHQRTKCKRSKPTYPWTLLVSMQDGGKLIVVAQNIPIVVELAAGDGVLFRGDVRHGGAAYDREHIRLHEYWEPLASTQGTWRFRVKADGSQSAENDLHSLETGATWNASNANNNPKAVYRGPIFSYETVVSGDQAILGIDV